MISYSQIILVVIVLIILIVSSNTKYFKTVNKIYDTLSKIPKLVIIVISILSLLGLSHIVEYPTFKKQIKISEPIISKKTDDNNESTKRNVSESTKKLVAANQKWKCGLCQRMLDETYEVDHIIPLYKDGSNNIDNLMALDPICHRKKTIDDRLNLTQSNK